MASNTCILLAHDNDIMRNIVPIKVYEYMAAGKPVIAIRLPGFVREFGEDNGVLYIDKPEEMLKLAEELEERKKILSEGIKTKKFIEPSSWDVAVGKFERS